MASHYRAEFEKHGVDSRSLHIPKQRQQSVSFQVLTEIETPFRGRVLDVGCGFGDFLAFAKERRLDVRYTGVEIVPEFLEVARARHPEADLRAVDLLLDPLEERWDWVVLSGTLNFRLREGDTAEYVRRMLRRMFELAERGVAANFLSTRVDYQKPDAHHSDPAELLRFALALTPRAALRHDYMPYQFTLYAYRDARIGDQSIFAARLEAPAR
jgi:SAM-dependent methyltransferase